VILDGVLPEGEGVPMKMGKKKMIPALAQEDEPFQLLLVHPAKKVRGLMRAKAAVTSWPLHRAKVESIVRQAVYSNGMMRVPIKYYGAHTGRWSGTAGVNLLNLGGKGNRKTGKQHHPLIGKVRNALLAPKGKTLVIADSCQIEARELAWIAGQNDLVESYRAGGDPYSELATEIFGEPVWKPTKEELLTPEGVILDIRRGWGKDTELGAGFGLGPNTMFLNCRKNKTLRPLFDSGEYDWNFIDNIIKTYRKKRYMIPKFWKTIEKSFRWVTKYHNEVAEYYIPGGEITFQGIAVKYNAMLEPTLRFWRDGSDTIIQLPSGRRLFYRHAVVTRKKELKYIWGPLYGGMLTENIIQAICRDLLAGWLLECERVRIPIILHTYDELVGCVPIDRAVEVLEQMIRIMNTGPDWTAGLPLDTEGGISPCFKK
jgi:DNA polymerase